MPTEVLWRALNAELPYDMSAPIVEDAPADFHAQRNAQRKRYRYFMCDTRVRDVFRRRHAWQLFNRLDVPAMQRAAAILIGTHDFISFQSSGSERETTERTVFDLTIQRTNRRTIMSCNWRLKPAVISTIWSATSSARWSKLGRGGKAKNGWPRYWLHAIAAALAPPRRRRACFWSVCFTDCLKIKKSKQSSEQFPNAEK